MLATNIRIKTAPTFRWKPVGLNFSELCLFW